MEETTILKDFTDAEKGAYLGAIASLATADHSASDEEIAAITELADAAGISDTQKQVTIRAAREITNEELEKCLEILKNSKLRFSLITDLISFAKSDGQYSDNEKMNVEKIAQYLGIDNKQFSLLDHFVTKSNETAKQTGEVKQGFLESLGLGDKFKEGGINISDVGKGLLAVAAPLMLAKLFMGGRNSRIAWGGRSMGPGGLGLGSVIAGLSGGRGYGNTGGLLSRLFSAKVF